MKSQAMLAILLTACIPAEAEGDSPRICLVVSARLIDPAGQPITESTVNILEKVSE